MKTKGRRMQAKACVSLPRGPHKELEEMNLGEPQVLSACEKRVSRCRDAAGRILEGVLLTRTVIGLYIFLLIGLC